MESRFPSPGGFYIYLGAKASVLLFEWLGLLTHDIASGLAFIAMEACMAWYAWLCYRLGKPYSALVLLIGITLLAWLRLSI